MPVTTVRSAQVLDATIATADVADDAITYAKLQNISATQRIIARNTAGAGDPEEVTVSQLLDWLTTTRGSILYRGASAWLALTPGTSGDVLQTNGAGADPTWVTPSGGGGARSIPTFLPYAAEFPSTNFPQLQLVNRRPVLSFDGATDEACYWTFVAPQGFSTTSFTAVVYYIAASATSGTIRFEGLIEAVTAADAVDLDATTSFDTTNSNGGTVPGTAGYMQSISITLTNNDSVAAGDLVRFQLNRDANGTTGTDDVTTDIHVLAVDLRYG